MNTRENFNSRLGFILVSAGCAIGLGNVWKFPYICGKYGGAAFILIYLLFLAILGLPILICEFAIGRGSKKSIVESFNILESSTGRWHRFKWFGMAGNYLLMMFYTMVSGWMFYYAYKMITGELSGLDPEGIANNFTNMLDNPYNMILWAIIAIVIGFAICGLGLENGVEKITKVIMTLLFLLMIVLAVNSVFLNGASKGIEFYLVPDINKLKEAGIGNAVFAAMTHAFFTLGVGVGSMEIFGSYLDNKRKLTGEAINIVILDTLVALTAGLIIFPACFAYNIEPDAGPPLLFITLPNVFNNMPGGEIWGIVFFIFMSFAALSTVVAVFENIIAMSMELFHMERTKAVIANMCAMCILVLPAILGYNILKNIEPLGAGSTLMDLEDFIVSYNILPLGSLIFVLFCVKKNGWGFNNFLKETNNGEGISYPKSIKNYMAYILPVIIVAVYLKGYYDKFKDMGTLPLCIWMIIAIILLIITFSFTLPKKQGNNN